MVDTISLDEVIKNVKNNFDDEKSKEELKLGNCFPCDFSSSFEKIEEKERNKLIYEVLNCSSLNKREKEMVILQKMEEKPFVKLQQKKLSARQLEVGKLFSMSIVQHISHCKYSIFCCLPALG